MRPDYAGGSLVNLVASVVAARGGKPLHEPLKKFPSVSSDVANATNIVLLIIDGLGDTFLENTIVASTDPTVRDCAGTFTSLGNNLIGNPASCLVALQPSDRVGDADLGQLVDDGTPGDAHFPLLPASQAIGAANDAACPRQDQLGQSRRPQCDIGAVEFRRKDVPRGTR